jgi:hypothetical protein
MEKKRHYQDERGEKISFKATLAAAPKLPPVKHPWDTESPNCNIGLVQVKDSDSVLAHKQIVLGTVLLLKKMVRGESMESEPRGNSRGDFYSAEPYKPMVSLNLHDLSKATIHAEWSITNSELAIPIRHQSGNNVLSFQAVGSSRSNDCIRTVGIPWLWVDDKKTSVY